MNISYKQFYIFIFLIAALIFFLTGYFSFNGLYGQDGYSYLHQSKTLFTSHYHHDFYPPVYAFAGWIINYLIQDHALSLQLISLFAVAVAAIVLQRVLNLLCNKTQTTCLYTVIVFLLSPFVIRSSVLVMSDALAMMLVLCVLYFCFKQGDGGFIMVCIFFSLAALTRYASVVLLLPLMFFAFLNVMKQKHNFKLAIGFSIIFVLFLANFFLWTSKTGSINHQWLILWDWRNFFKNSFSTLDGIQTYYLPNILYPLKLFVYPGFLPLFLILIWFVRKTDFTNIRHRLVVISLFIYFLFLAGIPFQNDRFLLIAFPFVLILLFPAFCRLIIRFEIKPLLIIIVVFAQVALCFRAIYPFYFRNKVEREISEKLVKYQGNTLYSFDIDVALKGKDLKFDYKNLLDSNYSQYLVGSLVLFNEKKLAQQWSDRNPMLNFAHLRDAYNITTEEMFIDDWVLYSVHDKKKSP